VVVVAGSSRLAAADRVALMDTTPCYHREAESKRAVRETCWQTDDG